MVIKIFKENINGKIELTKKELEDLLEEARLEGYTEGYNIGRSTTPVWPMTYPATSPYWWDYNKVTCSTGNCEKVSNG